LLLGAPPDPAPEDPTIPAEYDYSSDTYLEPSGANTDEGLQVRRDDTTGCHYLPKGTTHPESQVHRWVSDPLEAEFKMTERGTLKLYTKTINNALLTGTLCTYLFVREESGSPPVAKDKLLTNVSGSTEYWTYTPEKNLYWPTETSTEKWVIVTVPMKFNGAPYTIPAGDRLGVAISVERGNTPSDSIQFMYDNPAYPSRLEVGTSTPIEGG